MAKIIEQSTYRSLPIPQGEGVLHIAENQIYNSTFILDKDNYDIADSSIPKYIVLEEGAKLELYLLILGDIRKKLNIEVYCIGKNSIANISGVYLLHSEEVVDINILMYHKASDCKSYQNFRGLVAGSSKFSFQGKIIVSPTANRTEAYQENHNISLSSKAKVDTMPQLEIYVDDVKCSHGATIGKLDSNEQFYMRSRGIPENEVKFLQILSFLYPVLGKMNLAGDENLETLIENTIPKLLI